MKYEIIIKKTEEVTRLKKGEWGVIDKRPWTQEEVADQTNHTFYRSDSNQFLERNPLKELMGYRPERDTVETVETEILKQTVDNLDLAAVIKAINNL